MLGRNTDHEWEKFGQTDPYFGVLSQDKFKTDHLTAATKQEFFDSGTSHVRAILATVHHFLDPNFQPHRALDFGCGVGRLVIPLAGVAQEVVGVDVSAAMLQEAQRNCADQSLKNVWFALSDDDLSQVEGRFNFIHSFIVFQHIPVRRGERLFEQLLARLEAGGVGVVHFTYGYDLSAQVALAQAARRTIPGAAKVLNLLRGRSLNAPQMQMNAYSLNRLMAQLQAQGIRRVYTELVDQAGYRGVMLYFQRDFQRDKVQQDRS